MTISDLMPLGPEPALTKAARRILDAASGLFYEQGIHAVGVDTIAETAGVTKKTIYDRFGSKEALVVAYLQDRDRRWRRFLESSLAETVGLPGVDRILAVYDISEQWAERNSTNGCSAINAQAEIPDASYPSHTEVVRQKVWMHAVFRRLCVEAEAADSVGSADLAADADELAHALMLLYEGALVTLGMGTFEHPFRSARRAAGALLGR